MKLLGATLHHCRRALLTTLVLAWWPQAAADPFNPALEGQLELKRLRWQTLMLESKGLLASLEARIDLDPASANAVPWQPMPHATVPLLGPAGDSLLLLGADIKARVAVARKQRKESVWFESRSGQVLQQLRFEGGEEPEQKAYRFGEGHIYRLRRAPASPDEEQQVERWSEVEESTYPHNLQDPACELIVESTTLVYLIAVADPALQPLPWSICVFSRKRLYPISVASLPEESIKVEYLERNGQKSRKQKKRLMAQVLELGMSQEARRRVPADTFYFLGMKAPVILHVDPESRAPLRVQGQVSDYGEAKLQLRELHLRDTASR